MTEGRKNGRTERRKDGRTEGRKDGRTEGRKDGRTEGRKDGRTEGRTFEYVQICSVFANIANTNKKEVHRSQNVDT